MARARFHSFVGRAAELELLQQALQADEAPFSVLYIFGPGGVGKTTLLHLYARIAAQHGRAVFRLDARDVDPSPQGFLLALSAQAGGGEGWLSLERLATLPPAVLFLDTYERLAPLDDWLRETFLPALPAHVLVIIAGRNPPAEPWRTDPAWRAIWACVRPYGGFAHDWRAEPLSVWRAVMAERQLDLDFRPEPVGQSAPPPLLVLSQPEFADAVRQALRDYHRPEALARNPLLRSRILRDRAGTHPNPEDLQSLLCDAAATLTATPKNEKFYRALDLTFFRPALTQDAAAERLGLPFNTYRYHLNKGIERVTEWLWHRELYGPDA